MFQAADGDPFGVANGLMVPALPQYRRKLVTLAVAVTFLPTSLPVAVCCFHVTHVTSTTKGLPVLECNQRGACCFGTLNLMRN